MAAAGWGRIINISGLAARQTGLIIGSIRNVAVSALTKNLADELGSKGINVTVVHPGLTRTEKTAPLVVARAASNGVTPEIERRLAANVTIARRHERHRPSVCQLAPLGFDANFQNERFASKTSWTERTVVATNLATNSTERFEPLSTTPGDYTRKPTTSNSALLAPPDMFS
ncbi:SDR family NAD(P)-dependent oxidoreductase [Ancylobacter dichloromethanicus]